MTKTPAWWKDKSYNRRSDNQEFSYCHDLWIPSFKFCIQNFVNNSSFCIHTKRPAYEVFLDIITVKMLCEIYKFWSCLLFNLVWCRANSFRRKYCYQLRAKRRTSFLPINLSADIKWIHTSTIWLACLLKYTIFLGNFLFCFPSLSSSPTSHFT